MIKFMFKPKLSLFEAIVVVIVASMYASSKRTLIDSLIFSALITFMVLFSDFVQKKITAAEEE